VGANHIAYLPHDAYYHNFNHFTQQVPSQVNWDHPDALDTELMIEHIQTLKANHPVELPIYDFKQYQRSGAVMNIQPQPIILVEGILIFTDARLRKLFDVKIFVDTDADLRFIRRLQRDISERGRTPQSVIDQYLTTVRPMHLEFVEPSKRYADVIIPEGGRNEVAIDMVVARIMRLVTQDQ
jgi:uridine kinase